MLSEAGKWRNVPCCSKCKMCNCHLLDDLKSVQKKHNLCSGWAQLKLSPLTYTSSGAFAHSSAIFGCKITVNTCTHFLFKSLNLQTARTRWIFLSQAFSTTSFGFSLVTVSRLCWFTAAAEWTWCAFQKIVQICFLQSSTQFQLRHRCISIFHLEWSKYLLSTSLWAQFES